MDALVTLTVAVIAAWCIASFIVGVIIGRMFARHHEWVDYAPVDVELTALAEAAGVLDTTDDDDRGDRS